MCVCVGGGGEFRGIYSKDFTAEIKGSFKRSQPLARITCHTLNPSWLVHAVQNRVRCWRCQASAFLANGIMPEKVVNSLLDVNMTSLFDNSETHVKGRWGCIGMTQNGSNYLNWGGGGGGGG